MTTTNDNVPAILAAYRKLHDGLSEYIESGRDVPVTWLADQLEAIGNMPSNSN